MLILVGASACGKTEAVKELVSQYGMEKLVTYTTRKMRIKEIDGVDYHFITKDEFLKKEQDGFFFETACYNDNYYGTALEDIKDNKVVILEPTGALNYLDKMGDKVKVILLDSSEEARRRRMKERGDLREDIERRIRLDRQHFENPDLKRQAIIIDSTSNTLSELAEEIYHAYKEGL